MRILVMGAGVVGGYFGGRLQAAGQDVTFVARGRSLEALRTRGLRITSPNGDVALDPVQATSDPAEIGARPDVVLFTVKMYDAEAAAHAIRPIVGRETMVVTVQNGVESASVIGPVLGPERVVSGTAYFLADVPEPGLVRHRSLGRLIFGEADGCASPRTIAFRDALVGAGCGAMVSDRIEAVLWEKFVLLTTFSGMTGVTRLPAGRIRQDPDVRALYQAALGEVVALAEARRIAIRPDMAEAALALLDSSPAEVTSSLLQDLEAGKRLELPWLSGTVVRLGREAGVPTPIHHFLATALKLHAEGCATAAG